MRENIFKDQHSKLTKSKVRYRGGGTSVLGGQAGAWPQNLPLKFLLEPQILPAKI